MLRSNVRRGACSAVAAAGAIALGLGVAAPANATVDPESGAVTIDLAVITDFHGALLTAPNIAAQVQDIRDANEDTIFASVGDSIGGSTFESAIDQDFPTISALNAAGLEVSTVGNHEFDRGFDFLVDEIEPRADFPYLAANVTGQTDLPPYFIVDDLPSGVTVAFVGTVTQETPSVVAGSGIEGLTFGDPIEATNRYAAELSDGNPANGEADIVVALAHEATGVMADGMSDDVDALFTGHSHETLTAETGAGAPVIQAGASGSVLGRVSLTISADGETITAGTPATLPVTPLTSEQANGTDPLDAATFEPATTQIVRDAFAASRELGAREVGTTAEPFLAASNTGQPNGATTPSHRGAESPLNNLLAEVYQETVNTFGLEADFGVMNPGGIRADLDPNGDGSITFREAFNVTPFGNTVGVIDLTGAQVDTLLEQQFAPRSNRPVLALGLSPEVTYYYDPTAPAGDRVNQIFVGGMPIDPAATYTVASNTFLLGGEDGFTIFRDGTNFRETGVVDAQAFQDFLGLPENQDLTPTYEQRSVGIHEVTDFTQAIAPGDEVTIDFSSLSFTSTEPKPTSMVAIVGDLGTLIPEPREAGAAAIGTTADGISLPAAEDGTVLAETPIDNTIVTELVPGQTSPAGNNETGRTTMTFTVPEDTADGQFTVSFAWGVQYIPFSFTVAADAQPPVVSPEPTNPTPTAPAPTDPPVDGGDDQAGPGEGTLPETGAELAGPLVIVAMLVLLAGLGLVLRRRAV